MCVCWRLERENGIECVGGGGREGRSFLPAMSSEIARMCAYVWNSDFD